MSRFPFRQRFIRFCFLCVAVLGLSNSSFAENLKIKAQLIWGTNDERDFSKEKKDCKAVDQTTEAKLKNCFKWTHYWEITNQIVTVPSRSTKSLVMSKRCTVEITELEGPKVELKLIGEGKPVTKAIKPLSKGELTTIGGEDKSNGSAWFIVIHQLE